MSGGATLETTFRILRLLTKRVSLSLKGCRNTNIILNVTAYQSQWRQQKQHTGKIDGWVLVSLCPVLWFRPFPPSTLPAPFDRAAEDESRRLAWCPFSTRYGAHIRHHCRGNLMPWSTPLCSAPGAPQESWYRDGTEKWERPETGAQAAQI